MFSGKLNKLRTFALGITLLGFIIMYLALLAKNSLILMAILMVLGFLTVIGSSVIYFFVGMLSTRAVHVECPTCGKTTKMLGKDDDCMFCKQKLTLDPDLINQN